jgi:excisionase family DNA binding protein
MATQNLSERPFMTVRQVAEALSVNRNTVYNWINNGLLGSVLLPGKSTYRIPRDAFELFIEDISWSVRKPDGPCRSGKEPKWGGRFFEKGQRVRRVTQ